MVGGVCSLFGLLGDEVEPFSEAPEFEIEGHMEFASGSLLENLTHSSSDRPSIKLRRSL
jgi:hypothetical protein